jgi:dTDP-4-dehydrorhamnose reductase
MNRIIVTGANGQMGQELQRSPFREGYQVFFYTREELDIISYTDLKKVFDDLSPTHVINLAAYTNVEKAEIEEQKAYEINVIGPKNLAILCKEKKATLIHFSTDYVFGESEKPTFNEDDETSPLNVYGMTKLEGEEEIKKSKCLYVIIRTSWVYSNHGNNFYLKMLQLSQKMSELNVVDDQWGSPTSSKELCRAIAAVLITKITRKNSGIYNFAGLGKTNWKEFATEIFRQGRIPVVVKGIPASGFGGKAVRPSNSYLSSMKFYDGFGIMPMHWKSALAEIISEKKISPIKVGYLTEINDKKYIIASVDWSKRDCVIAEINNMNIFFALTFEDLYTS